MVNGAAPRCPVSPVLKRDATSTVLESPFTLAQGGGLFSVTLYFHWVMPVARRRPQALSTRVMQVCRESLLFVAAVLQSRLRDRTTKAIARGFLGSAGHPGKGRTKLREDRPVGFGSAGFSFPDNEREQRPSSGQSLRDSSIQRAGPHADWSASQKSWDI